MRNIVKKVVLIAFIFFYSFHIASAGIVINEIMYDVEGTDTDREWVEVYNNSSIVDLSTYKFFEANSNHGLILEEGDKNIPNGGYAVIVLDKAKFKTDNPGFLGSIFRASFSLGNEGEALVIKDADLNIVDQYTYSSATGASGNGKSLQKISGTWQESTPTGGKENTSSVVNTNNEQADTNIDSSSSAPSKSIKISQPSIMVEAILKNNVVFAGLGTKFQGKVSRDGEALFYGRYFWNFGDGSFQEMKVNTGGEVSHTYFYPGEYALSLEYYVNDYGDPEASDSLIVKVIGADILISSVGTESDFFIELSNNTDKDVDIGKWMLTSGDKRFVFPKNTIIPAKKKITFSPWVTGFVFSDKNNLKLVNPDWKTVFDYAFSVTPAPPAVAVNNSKPKVTVAHANVTNSAIAENVTTEFVNQAQALDETSEVSSTSLSAQAISSKVADGANKKILYYMILLALLLAGGGAIYFIRRSNRPALETGEDFDILDE